MLTHAGKTAEQFGSTAHAYLSSTVHSNGADLDAVAGRLSQATEATVLDLGCGAGHLSFTIAPLVKSVTAYDLSSEMLEVVRTEAKRRALGNLTTIQGNVQQLPFADASFDWVCTRYSAHHWTEIKSAIREMHRVLKPGGGLIVIDLCTPQHPLLDTHLQAIELLRDSSHLRDYSFTEWKTMLETQGFAIEAHTFWRLPLNFQSWVERAQTPQLYVEAIRSLFKKAPQEVRDYFEVAEDGSFCADTVLIEAKRT